MGNSTTSSHKISDDSIHALILNDELKQKIFTACENAITARNTVTIALDFDETIAIYSGENVFLNGHLIKFLAELMAKFGTEHFQIEIISARLADDLKEHPDLKPHLANERGGLLQPVLDSFLVELNDRIRQSGGCNARVSIPTNYIHCLMPVTHIQLISQETQKVVKEYCFTYRHPPDERDAQNIEIHALSENLSINITLYDDHQYIGGMQDSFGMRRLSDNIKYQFFMAKKYHEEKALVIFVDDAEEHVSSVSGLSNFFCIQVSTEEYLLQKRLAQIKARQSIFHSPTPKPPATTNLGGDETNTLIDGMGQR